jgi:hypothetical protein
MRHLHLVPVLGLFLCSASFAANWKYLEKVEQDGSIAAAIKEYDKASIRRSGSRITVWERTTFDEPSMLGIFRTSVVRAQKVYDCGERTVQMLTFTFYDEAGKPLHTSGSEGDVDAIVPDSNGEYILEQFCAVSKKGQ